MTTHSSTGESLPELAKVMPSPAGAMLWQRYVHRHLPEFKELLCGLRVSPGPGSMSTAEAFWLFRLVAELRPSTIIDSGSATGWSAWVIAAGAPRSRVLCFDPYRVPDSLPDNAEFFKTDWTRVVRQAGPESFALFDDHVNQRRRVLQAQRAGLVNVVFHDVYRQLTKSTVSLAFVDLIGRADFIHTFEPLWETDPVFSDISENPQMYRYLTWLQLTQNGRGWIRARWIAGTQRHALRNPMADKRSRLNWKSRG